MTLSLFDYITVFFLIVLNLLFWKFNILNSIKLVWILILWFLLFAGILPILSMAIEIDQVKKEYEAVDSFNLLYLYFRIPKYWIIGWIELVIIIFIGKHQEEKE